MRIDLHTHSSVSDGTQMPADVIDSAVEAGLDVVALTDHDSVEGWDEASARAEHVGITFVPGIEVSCRHRGISIHLLAYWHDRDDATVTDMLALTRDSRVQRARAMVSNLSRTYPLTWDDVVAQAEDAHTIGRPHIADALVALGVVPDRGAAFDTLLSHSSQFYVPHYSPEVLDAVRALRGAGGVPVFAHPGADGRGRVVTTSVIESMAKAGMVGLEIDHRDHSPRQRTRLTLVAQRLNLVRTGASDYHGAGKPNQLGENLTTAEAFAALEAARGT